MILGVTSYSVLVFASIGIAAQVGGALLLSVAVVAAGTSIMHDANHGAFSRSNRSNRLVAYSADLLGASSWVWRFKHNTLHHTGTNVAGIDADIDQSRSPGSLPSSHGGRGIATSISTCGCCTAS